jgi:hypothetical protein
VSRLGNTVARLKLKGIDGARASAENSDFKDSMHGRGNAGFRAPTGSPEGMLKGPKKHDFWINLKIAPHP